MFYPELEDRIFAISSEDEFNAVAMEVFRFQMDHLPIYRTYAELVKRTDPTHYSEIPFLPISFFKDYELIATGLEAQTVFLSSGTTGSIRSAHPVASTELYRRSFLPSYRRFIGDPEDQVILALLPSYLEQGHSSLVFMVEELIKTSASPLSGFVLNEPEVISERYRTARETGKKVVLFGVSYALLDLASSQPDLKEAIIIETGGMKGRRKEISKEELHTIICSGTGVPFVSSEYGMTELLSQAYSDKDGLFVSPPWMKVLIRDVNDPLSWAMEGKTGGVNVIDLANLYSCSFIATQDLGKKEGEAFRILGRFDLSDLRGCNLMVE